MKALFVFVVLIFAALFAVGPGQVNATEYWPLQDGLVWTYSGSPGYSVEMNSFGQSYSRIYDWGSGFVSLGFSESESGDVVVESWGYWSEGGFCGTPDTREFNPPLTYLDLPLEVGKSWTSVSGGSVLVGEVLRAETITVAAGTFEAVVVRHVAIMPEDWPLAEEELYLAPAIGQIMHDGNMLVSFSGATVSVERNTWGAVKALYR